MNRHLANEQATIDFATEILAAMPSDLAGWTLLLSGELGAGKSTFARAFIEAAGHAGAVPSPTYTLVEPYNLSRAMIYHVDLYRISDESELRYLGFGELEDGCRLVEWPERAPGLAQAADLHITLKYDGEGRAACLSGISARGASLIQKIN